jgi:hypothetical protein
MTSDAVSTGRVGQELPLDRERGHESLHIHNTGISICRRYLASSVATGVSLLEVRQGPCPFFLVKGFAFVGSSPLAEPVRRHYPISSS